MKNSHDFFRYVYDVRPVWSIQMMTIMNAAFYVNQKVSWHRKLNQSQRRFIYERWTLIFILKWHQSDPILLEDVFIR
jgi:hypothetical protein